MALGATVSSARQSEGATRAARTDALVISNDDGLVIELGPLLGDRYRVHAVDTTASIAGQVHVARWIGILDVDSQVDAYDALSHLVVQHPGCPLILVSAQPRDWIASVGRGAVLAVIGRAELATARLNEALRTAENRVRQDCVEEPSTGQSARPNRFDVNPARRGSIWAATAMLLVLLGANGLWLHHRFAADVRSGANSANRVTDSVDASAVAVHGADRRPSAIASQNALTASPALPLAESGPVPPGPSTGSAANGALAPRQQNVMELLSAARVALRDQKLLLPRLDGELRGDSALELYGQVLSRDPLNDEALDGVRRLLVVGHSRIAADVVSGKLDDADQLLGVLKAAGVGTSDLGQLASELNAARAKWLAQRAAQNISAGDFKTAEQLLAKATVSGADASTVRALRTEEDAKKLELQLAAMAGQVKAAIQAGSLLLPVTDNARTRLAAMRSISRNQPLTLQAQHELQTALVQAGEQATRAAQFDLAQRDLNAAAEFGSLASLSEARRQLQGAKEAAERARAVAAVALPQPGTVTARVAAIMPAAEPPPPRTYIFARPTRVLPVTYPANANANGSVIVEFTLSARGLASNVTVVQSDPPGVFDLAATNAVKRGRYSTDELVEGQPARARIKLRFNVPGK